MLERISRIRTIPSNIKYSIGYIRQYLIVTKGSGRISITINTIIRKRPREIGLMILKSRMYLIGALFIFIVTRYKTKQRLREIIDVSMYDIYNAVYQCIIII